MEKLLYINGISPYLYALAVFFRPSEELKSTFLTCLCIFLAQLIVTIVIGITCKDKKKLAQITMINKFIQIPYFVMFFVFSALFVFFGTFFFGIGVLFLPVFVLIDFGVFLSTLIPEELCTMKLIMLRRMSGMRALRYLVGNAIYIVDIILSVKIYDEYKKL